LDENLKRWSGKSVGGNGVSTKTTRKTWEPWLFYYYGSRIEIYQSQGAHFASVNGALPEFAIFR